MSGWQEYAACGGADPEQFFPGKGGTNANPAKRVCARCPVRAECLRFALANDITHGVFGGLAPRTRRPLQDAS